MVLVEYTDAEPLLHFVGEDGSEITVLAEGADLSTEFQVAGGRVYYQDRHAGRSGVTALSVPDAPGDLQAVRASPDGDKLAWLFTDDQINLRRKSGEAHFRLIVTDGQGNGPQEIWHRVETPPDTRWINLLGWRSDAEEIYLSQSEYQEAAPYFKLNPGIMAVGVVTDGVTVVGDLEGVADAAVSPDGVWLVQAMTNMEPTGNLTITLLALIDKAKIHIPGTKGAWLAGDFSFAPGSGWLAWREWGTMPDGSVLVVRARHLPDGEPFTVYQEASDDSPVVIGGWIGEDDLVLVQENGAGPSTVISLPSSLGLGSPLSPFAFLGVLE
jgi:hypothetical protein